MSNENYDATWYDYSYERERYVTRYGYATTTNAGNYSMYKYAAADARALEKSMFAHLYPDGKKLFPGLKPPFPGGETKNSSDKETTDMARNSYGLSYDEQNTIDEAVREAINAPKLAAEIANRKAAVEALGVEDNYEVGTVLTFKRKSGKVEHEYVALKASDEKWYVTGGHLTGSGAYNWDSLLTWMTTGSDPIVSDVQVATVFTPITWAPAPVVPAQSASVEV